MFAFDQLASMRPALNYWVQTKCLTLCFSNGLQFEAVDGWHFVEEMGGTWWNYFWKNSLRQSFVLNPFGTLKTRSMLVPRSYRFLQPILDAKVWFLLTSVIWSQTFNVKKNIRNHWRTRELQANYKCLGPTSNRSQWSQWSHRNCSCVLADFHWKKNNEVIKIPALMWTSTRMYHVPASLRRYTFQLFPVDNIRASASYITGASLRKIGTASRTPRHYHLQ